MKKNGKKQIDLLKSEIKEFANRRVCGGVDAWVDLWRKYAMNTSDWKTDYLEMGANGWNRYDYRGYVDVPSIWRTCEFDEHMTYTEFYMMFDSLWVSVSVSVIKNLIGDSSDELAY